MSNPVSSLPDAWIDRIWATMRAFYGASFDRQWECPAGTDPLAHVTAMRQVWARELAGFNRNPAAIAYALDNLGEFPPNLPQFRASCSRAPEPKAVELPAPKTDRERVEKMLEQARARATDKTGGNKGWAWKLKARDEAGERLTITQRTMYKVVTEPREDTA